MLNVSRFVKPINPPDVVVLLKAGVPFVEFCAKAEKLRVFDVENGSVVSVVSVFLARSAKLMPPALPKMGVTTVCSADFGASWVGVDVEFGALTSESIPVTGVRVVDGGNLNVNPVLGLSFGLFSLLPFVLPPNMFVDGDLITLVAPKVAEPPNNGFDSAGLSVKMKINGKIKLHLIFF